MFTAPVTNAARAQRAFPYVHHDIESERVVRSMIGHGTCAEDILWYGELA